MKKLYLSILWHQHQPYYKDPASGKALMPWVYLHGLKDYYEMAAHVAESSNVKMTFNYVPSLLIQLKDYSSVFAEDTFLEGLRKSVPSLNSQERRLIFNQCFMANTDNMIRPFSRFSELYDKQDRAGGVDVFSNDEFLDLEVLYILAWCGEFMRRDEELVGNLIKKERYFSEEDKIGLLEKCTLWVNKIKEIHQRLHKEGKAELSCTPYYHPILPLLADIGAAKEACADMPMPSMVSGFEEDASWHISEGLKEFEEYFGIKAKGMWPAEGSISKKTAELYANKGVRWIASDEEVLGNSLRIDLKNWTNRPRLYQKHFQMYGNNKINIFFRDKELSDLIGFTYSSWKTEDAVKDFIGKLRRIYDSVNFSPHVSVILDGENAWEYYKCNGFDFFTLLYKTLGETDWLETQTFSEAISNHNVPEEILQNIVAGSWIMGNFCIWIGHEEKNKGWEMLARTRKEMMKVIDMAPESARKAALEALHAAEGSDWFWWFGDDHYSAQSDTFDRLFRTYLINARKSLGLDIPQELFRPIKRKVRQGAVQKPVSFITPVIDGVITDYYEWRGAGVCDLKADAGSMHAGGDNLKKLTYGFNHKNLYLALNTDFRDKQDYILEIEVSYGEKSEVVLIVFAKDKAMSECIDVTAGNILEMALPIKDEWRKAGIINLTFVMKAGDIVTEKAPLYNPVEIDILNNFEDEWII